MVDLEGLKSMHKHECAATKLVANPNIEAVAAAIYNADDCYNEPWGEQLVDVCQWYRRMARHAIAAALTPGDTPLTDHQKAIYYAATGDYEGVKDTPGATE